MKRICDGCDTAHISPGPDLPSGVYVNVMDVTGASLKVGRLFACDEHCLLAAYRRRHEIWDKG